MTDSRKHSSTRATKKTNYTKEAAGQGVRVANRREESTKKAPGSESAHPRCPHFSTYGERGVPQWFPSASQTFPDWYPLHLLHDGLYEYRRLISTLQSAPQDVLRQLIAAEARRVLTPAAMK